MVPAVLDRVSRLRAVTATVITWSRIALPSVSNRMSGQAMRVAIKAPASSVVPV